MRIRPRPRFVVAAVALAVSVVACGDDDDTIGFDDFVVVTDDAAPVRVERGGSFFVELESNASTGYSWAVTAEPDGSVARVVTQVYVPDETEGDVVGAGGVERLEVEGVGVGTTALGLEYRGPGVEPDVADTREFTIEVVAP
jgi:predicted secreted protein